MFTKQVLAVFLWCHCYQVVLNPLIQVFYIGNQLTHLLTENHGHLRHSGNIYVSGLPITVEANQVALTPGHEIVLRCYIKEYPDAEFSWQRIKVYSNKETPSSPVIREEIVPLDETYIIDKNSLALKSPSLDDVGDYICRVKVPVEDVENEKTIAVRPRPIILDFDIDSLSQKSTVAEIGDRLNLTCNVVDDYAPLESTLKVSWHMYRFDENDTNEVIDGEDGIQLVRNSQASISLIIDKVRHDHRRFYKCHTTNGVTDNDKVILIRVKSKNIFIWPIVGIIIETVILLGIICIVENRKVEPDKEAYSRKAI